MIATNANAHFLPHKKHLTLKQKVEYFERSIHHDKTAIVWIKHFRHNKHNKHDRELASSYEHLLRWHEKALKWHEKLYTRYSAKLSPVPQGLPPHYSDWLCIHRFEGSWTDPNSPYYGGLQMDWNFMNSYGGALLRSKGTANNWTPLEQMWVAEKAYQSGRGFYPWPNTARYCGLI